MHRPLSTLLLFPALCLAADVPATDTHQGLAQATVDLLSQTEICLNSCRDEASVRAALPRLKELAEQARQLTARQKALPDPTVQDDMAAQSLVADFQTLWNAIQEHLERLEREHLLSPAMREILRIAPPEATKTNAGK